jgi:hypothetical protein
MHSLGDVHAPPVHAVVAERPQVSLPLAGMLEREPLGGHYSQLVPHRHQVGMQTACGQIEPGRDEDSSRLKLGRVMRPIEEILQGL